MQKATFLFIAFIFVSFIAQSQNTCIDAKNIQYFQQDTLPPPGTISPAGPDLGCLTVTGRQMWFYIPVCETFSVYQVRASFNSAGIGDSVGIILYGPFNQIVSNCTDLASNKIIACGEGPPFNSKFSLSLTDSLYEGNYYYVLLTFTDSFFPCSPTLDINQYGYYPACFECNNQVSVLYKNNLCLVTVDTAINKCVLTWEEFPGSNLLGYNIMRETSLTGLYDSITTIPLGTMSTYTDMTSSPSQHNERYKVNGVDSCGQSNSLQGSPQWTSIHLISFAGGLNQANLIWNNVYNNTFVPQYYIYRNNNGTGWQVIDSIGIAISPVTYTDIFAPAGINQYAVELLSLISCVPMRTSSTPYTSVFSNTSMVTVTGTEEFLSNSSISIYPNPTNDFLCINTNFISAKEVSYTLFHLYGQKLKELYTGKSSIGKQEQKFSLKEFSSGIYFVKINAGGKEEVKKLVKQ
jgi:hypothetical protein